MNTSAPKVTKAKGDRLASAVNRFFDKVVEEPLLKLYFFNTDIAVHKGRFCSYLECVLADNESTYPGRSVLLAHTGHQIMDEAADIFVEMLVDTLRECEVAPNDIEKIHTRLSALKDLVVDKFVSPDTHVYKPQRMG